MTSLQGRQLDEPRAAARRQVDRAIHALSGPGGLHEARVALKRARALVRLCPPSRRGPGPKEIRRGLQKAGRRLSGQRDREAALEVIATLEDGAKVPDRVVEELSRPSENHVQLNRLRDEVVRDLGELAKRVDGLGADPTGERALEGLGRAYRQARRAWRRAVDHPTAGALHELRKRTKVFRYQLEWFGPVWPGVLSGWIAELHTMTDELGHTHDVTVLRRSLGEPRPAGARAEMAVALRALREDARHCRRWSLARGSRLFAEKPAAFGKRMARIAASVPAPTLVEPAQG